MSATQRLRSGSRGAQDGPQHFILLLWWNQKLVGHRQLIPAGFAALQATLSQATEAKRRGRLAHPVQPFLPSAVFCCSSLQGSDPWHPAPSSIAIDHISNTIRIPNPFSDPTIHPTIQPPNTVFVDSRLMPSRYPQFRKLPTRGCDLPLLFLSRIPALIPSEHCFRETQPDWMRARGTRLRPSIPPHPRASCRFAHHCHLHACRD